jgi:regulatory protein
MELRQSTFDPNFWEILSDGKIIQEIPISFPLSEIPTHFDSLQEIFSWLEQKETKLVKNAALNLLSRRSYTKAMLLKKLKEKKFSTSKCLQIIDECEKLGYLSDNDYAQRLLEQKIGQGYGPRYIEQYFRSKGLDPCFVRKNMDSSKQKELVKKWSKKMICKDQLKVKAYLLRKGFDFEIIR